MESDCIFGEAGIDHENFSVRFYSDFFACTIPYSVQGPDLPKGSESSDWPLYVHKSGVTEPINLLYMEYDVSVQDWVVVETYYDPGFDHYQPDSDDYVEQTDDGQTIIVIAADPSASRPPGARPRPPGRPNPPTIPKQIIHFEEKGDSAKCFVVLPPIEVVGVVIRRAFATIGSLMWGGIWVGIGSSSSGDPQLPPTPSPTPCNTGEPAIDDHEDFFEEVWEASGY